MDSRKEDLRAEAIAWHIRLRDDATADWPAFTTWLEADPARSEAYDAVALADRSLDERGCEPAPTAANDDARPSLYAGRFAWIGAVAAVLLIALLVWPLLHDSPIVVTTAPGQQRSIALADGGRIALNGDSAIELDGDDARSVRLKRGEAMFAIRHDSASPFEVLAGDTRLRDVGTRFNVVNANGIIRVEVAEGAVLYNPEREAVTLTAGKTLTNSAASDAIVLGEKRPESIGAWRRGQLSYREEPLSVVAADLARTIGVSVTVAPAIAARTFTGTINVDRDTDRLFARLETVLNVEAHKIGSGWRLDAARHPPR